MFIWNKNQCWITSHHFTYKFKYPINPSRNFWVLLGRSQSMGSILGQRPVKSRLGCSVWPKSWSLSRYFLGYDDIALKHILKRLKILSPVFCHFRGSQLALNGSNGNFCPHLWKNWLKIAILGHFKWFWWKVEESGPPLKWQNTGGSNSNFFKICF